MRTVSINCNSHYWEGCQVSTVFSPSFSRSLSLLLCLLNLSGSTQIGGFLIGLLPIDRTWSYTSFVMYAGIILVFKWFYFLNKSKNLSWSLFFFVKKKCTRLLYPYQSIWATKTKLLCNDLILERLKKTYNLFNTFI